MANQHTARVPISIIHKLEHILIELEQSISPYRPEFMARMHRAKASDLEGLDSSIRERCLNEIERLASNPELLGKKPLLFQQHTCPGNMVYYSRCIL